MRSDPQLSIARAWLSLDVGRPCDRRALASGGGRGGIRRAAPLLEGGSSIASGVAMLRATLAYQSGDLETARTSAEAADALERESGSPWRAVALTNLGCARYWLGDSEGARATLISVIQSPGPARTPSPSCGRWACSRCARPMRAISPTPSDSSSLASELTRSENLGEYWMGALTAAADGRLAERRGDLARARSVARAGRGPRPTRRRAPRSHLRAARARARVRRRRRPGGARDALREAARSITSCPAPGVLAHLVADAERRLRGKASHVTSAADDDLSSRELEVLRLLPSELSLREIGSVLFVSHNTVKTHAQRIYRKLGADTRAEAIVRARELRLL